MAERRRPPTGEEVRSARLFLGVAGVAYLGWWFLVKAMLPDAFNPLAGRLYVVGACAASLVGTFVSRHLRNLAVELLLFSVSFATVHYFWLVHHNRGDATWWGGALITVAVASAAMITRKVLLVYSVVTAVVALWVAWAEGELARSVFPPGVVTVLVLANFALRSRLRAEEERVVAVAAQRERDRAQEANRAKSMFLSLVSHELLTPLQTIQLSVDTVALRNANPSAVARIRRGVDRLTGIIQSLLMFSAAEKGNVEPVVVNVSVVDVARGVVEDLREKALAKGLSLQLHALTEDSSVRTDPELLSLVMKQLVDNAIAHTVKGSVEVEVGDAPSELRVMVRDTGPGISPTDQKRIFESFTMLEPIENKHLPGMGLGLAIVREVVRVLGYRVDIASTLGSGTTFTLVVPRAENSAKSAA